LAAGAFLGEALAALGLVSLAILKI
jgi:hypothetical protein